MSLPDTDTLARLALLAVAVYILVAAGVALLPYALLAVPLVVAVLGLRWLAGLLGTPGAVVTLAAGGLGIGLCAWRRRRKTHT